jgi:hypothetical protein
MLFETLVQIWMSNFKGWIYLAMIVSMLANSGLISLIYPIIVLGYAMLEETRPRRQFWSFFLLYTVMVVMIKFVFNLTILEQYVRSKAFTELDGWVRIGLNKYDDLGVLCLYMLPELLIAAFIILQEIILKLNGLHYCIEEDLETLNDSIQRSLLENPSNLSNK